MSMRISYSDFIDEYLDRGGEVCLYVANSDFSPGRQLGKKFKTGRAAVIALRKAQKEYSSSWLMDPNTTQKIRI